MTQEDPKKPVWTNVKILLLDSDGVLTDGGVYISENGEEIRRFSIKDGAGIKLIQKIGIKVAIVSSSSCRAVLHRAEALGIDECHIGAKDKVAVVEKILTRQGLGWSSCAYIGDDIADIPVMQMVGIPVSVADASPCVIEVSVYTTSSPGGHGAVRELAELIVPHHQNHQTGADFFTAI